jgi:drug/metabolite transporter (DMT)-like permease
MPESPSRPTFGQIYREQYRQVSSSRTSTAFRFITPVVLLIGAVVFRHSVVAAIIMVGLAILILAGVVIWTRIHHQGEMQ